MRPTVKQRQISTKPPATPEAAPRLPHERDESNDSQDAGQPREDMQQAFEDLEKGLVDTDLRGSMGVDPATRARHNTEEPTPPDPDRALDPNRSKLPDGKQR